MPPRPRSLPGSPTLLRPPCPPATSTGLCASTHLIPVHEFPWAPEGGVRRLEGRDAIAAYMSQLPGRIEFGPRSDIQVREVGDETIFQATGHHRRLDGTPRDLDYIGFITRRDGQVTRWQDYMNPLQLSERASPTQPPRSHHVKGTKP